MKKRIVDFLEWVMISLLWSRMTDESKEKFVKELMNKWTESRNRQKGHCAKSKECLQWVIYAEPCKCECKKCGAENSKSKAAQAN